MRVSIFRLAFALQKAREGLPAVSKVFLLQTFLLPKQVVNPAKGPSKLTCGSLVGKGIQVGVNVVAEFERE